MAKTLVITRHAAFVAACIEMGLIEPGHFEVVDHVNDGDTLEGLDVITSGLPLPLAATAASVTVIPLTLPPSLRGVELSKAQVLAHAGEAARFVVRKAK